MVPVGVPDSGRQGFIYLLAVVVIIIISAYRIATSTSRCCDGSSNVTARWKLNLKYYTNKQGSERGVIIPAYIITH